MKTIPITRYNTEFLGRGAKPTLVYYNPDNSVVVMDPSEQDIYDWVAERGEKLRENRFFLNDDTAAKIREWIDQNGTPALEQTPVVETVEDIKKFEIETLKTPEESDAKRSKAKKEILSELDNKLTVAQLTQVVKRLAKLI